MLTPAAIALVIAILFIIFFKDEKEKVEAEIETIIQNKKDRSTL